MPDMDGLAVSREIHRQGYAHRNTKLPYIIAMTAHTSLKDQQDCVSAGMDDYISKPLRISELGEKLLRCETKIADYNSSNSNQINSIIVAPTVSLPEIPLSPEEPLPTVSSHLVQNWDETWQYLMQITLDNQDFAIDLLQMSIHENKDRLERLKAAITQDPIDFVIIQSLAHQIRGSCGNLGLTVLQKLGQDLEQDAMNQRSENLVHYLHSIEKSMQDVSDYRLKLPARPAYARRI
jgi:CheY-like chemotaxis protein